MEVDVVIDYVHYDAEGNDWYNINDEYVALWNKGSGDADLSGWELKDEVDHIFHVSVIYSSGWTEG